MSAADRVEPVFSLLFGPISMSDGMLRRSLWQATIFSAIPPEIAMSTTLEILEAEALKLPPSERSHLLERLIASLDSDPEVEEAWEREADQREAALESGYVAEVSGHEAIARLRARLAR